MFVNVLIFVLSSFICIIFVLLVVVWLNSICSTCQQTWQDSTCDKSEILLVHYLNRKLVTHSDYLLLNSKDTNGVWEQMM